MLLSKIFLIAGIALMVLALVLIFKPWYVAALPAYAGLWLLHFLPLQKKIITLSIILIPIKEIIASQIFTGYQGWITSSIIQSLARK